MESQEQEQIPSIAERIQQLHILMDNEADFVQDQRRSQREDAEQSVEGKRTKVVRKRETTPFGNFVDYVLR